jgi:hypothetical protein
MPVRCTGLHDPLRTPLLARELKHEHAEHDEADQEMHTVDRSEKEIELEELIAREGVPHVDQPDPLDDLEDEENESKTSGQEGISPSPRESPGPGLLHAPGHCPRTRQEDDRVEYAQPEKQMGLAEQKDPLVLGPVEEVDTEVRGEDERLEQDEDPDVASSRNVLWRSLLGDR